MGSRPAHVALNAQPAEWAPPGPAVALHGTQEGSEGLGLRGHARSLEEAQCLAPAAVGVAPGAPAQVEASEAFQHLGPFVRLADDAGQFQRLAERLVGVR